MENSLNQVEIKTIYTKGINDLMCNITPGVFYLTIKVAVH